MAEAKRWSVTYTKHVKQKRKVYQDGFLELHFSSTGGDKLLLYDDSHKVIDTRFLKMDEVVQCHGSLTFDAHLVNIGDSSDDKTKPLVESNVQHKDTKPVGSFGTLHRNKPSFNSLSTGTKRSDVGANGGPENPPSLIHNIKKEKIDTVPKKREASQNQVNTTQIKEAQEWSALYTTQMTQKAKRYHDGILRLEFRGSRGNQVMLYDASRKLLDTRFLKKDEVFASGDIVAFDAHLVDVGDPTGSKKSLLCLDAQGKDVSKKIKLENVGTEKNQLQSMKETREWHALYTTQVTQKVKKYLDGILQLAFCVYQRKQVKLLNEDGTLLCSKYLSSSEDVRTGCTIQLTSYLVEVGEAHVLQGGLRNDASLGNGLGSYWSSSKNVMNVKLGANDTGNNLLRDAHQILSNLKRPVTQEKLSPSRKPPTREQICFSHSSGFQFNIDEKLFGERPLEGKFSERNVSDIPDDNSRSLITESSTEAVEDGSNVSPYKMGQSLPILGIISSILPDSGGKMQHLDPSSSTIFIGIGAPSKPISETVMYPEKAMANPASSILGPKAPKTMTMFSPEDAQAEDTCVQNDGMNYNMQINEPHSSTADEAGNSCDACQILNDVTDEKSDQPCADYEGIDNRCKEGVGLAFSKSNSSASLCSNGVDRESPKGLNRTDNVQIDMHDFPNFDLGF